MTIEGCTSSASRFSREEEDALRKDESTSAIMNRARQHAGRTGDVELRGDDKTRREVDREYKEHVGACGVGEGIKGTIEAIDIMGGLGESYAAGASVAVGAVGGLFLYAEHVSHMEEQKKKLDQAVKKDELHVALLTQLELPQAYKNIQVKRRPDAGQSFQSDAQKIATTFATQDKALVATLQLHCDRGMHAALDMRASGLPREDWLKSHPAAARALAEDAAFREGFDAIVWCGDQNLAEAKKDLEARDARYACAHVQVKA